MENVSQLCEIINNTNMKVDKSLLNISEFYNKEQCKCNKNLSVNECYNCYIIDKYEDFKYEHHKPDKPL